ncbi:hypothetical protein NBRC116586_23470 [Pseudooceanicola nitratireducens]
MEWRYGIGMARVLRTEETFETRLDEAEAALRKTFGGKPAGFEAALARAGRRLPRRARKAGREVLAAQQLAGHPQLRLQVDWARVHRALDRVIDGAKSVDMKDRRKGWVIGAAASLAFNLLLFFTLVVLFARWRGWI